jgi:hypothetical protein
MLLTKLISIRLDRLPIHKCSMQVHDEILGKNVEQVDENDVVLNLKRSSPEFNRFYHEERMAKLGEILWRVDPDAGSLNKMKSITAKDDLGISYPIIYINNSHIPIDDAFVVAHEIMHLVLNKEERSLIVFGKNRVFTDAFQTMLEDPLVDYILQNQYEFDVLKQYRTDFDVTIKDFEHPTEEPKEPLARVYLALVLSKTLLKLRMIKERDEIKDVYAFIEGYRRLNPNVSIISDEILSIIDSVGGIETIEGKKSAFMEITEKYNLGGILTIDHPE